MPRGNVANGDIALPTMVLLETALDNNVAVMARYAAEHGFALAPHGKTTMAPALFRRQLDAGAWGITVANMAQAEVAFGAGAQRVLVANEIVGRQDARSVVEAVSDGAHELYCLVDAVDGVELLDRNLAVAAMPGRLGVLVELGAPGGRSGARSEEAAVAVAQAVAASAHLRLAGVEGFEGTLAADRSPEALAKVDRYLEGLGRLALGLVGTGLVGSGPFLISAGGSKYFDRVAEVLGDKVLGGSLRHDAHDLVLVVRAGCYITHDHGIYAHASPLAAGPAGARLVAAIEVWAEVLSVPEPGLAIVGLGKRDAPYDSGLPVAVRLVRAEGGAPPEPLFGVTLSAMDDQHGYLRLGPAAASLAVGDRVGFGISHPCTAFDKWRTVLVVDDGYEVRDELRTWFH